MWAHHADCADRDTDAAKTKTTAERWASTPLAHVPPRYSHQKRDWNSATGSTDPPNAQHSATFDASKIASDALEIISHVLKIPSDASKTRSNASNSVPDAF